MGNLIWDHLQAEIEGQEDTLPLEEGWNYVKVKQSMNLLEEICV